jgi:hypothetical protein
VNGETPEKRGQSAKRSVAVPGQGGRGKLQWQMSVWVRPSRKSEFSACQGLWKIAGRSVYRGQTAALLSSSAYAKSLCLWRPSCILLRSFLPCKTCTRLHI